MIFMSKIHFIMNSIKEFRLVRNTINRLRLKRISNSNISDKEYLIKYGRMRLHYTMDLDNPKTFNEKINWYKLNYCNDLMRKVVDKIEAKEYIKFKGLDEILIKTIKTYNNVNEISIDELPAKFVVKNTMDSGGVFVCKNKNDICLKDLKQKIKKVSNFINGKQKNREPVYFENKNRIIVEELIETNDNHSPADYKFFCFNGVPKFLFVGTERDTEVKFDFFDIDFNWLNVRQGHKNNKNRPVKPKNYEKMLDICKILSADFPHVRVDLYNIDGEIYFGELTFYHFAGLTPFRPNKWDKIFGDMWDLSNIKE